MVEERVMERIREWVCEVDLETAAVELAMVVEERVMAVVELAMVVEERVMVVEERVMAVVDRALVVEERAVEERAVAS